MPMELEDETGIIIIDFNNNALKGITKAKHWNKHFKKVKEAFE